MRAPVLPAVACLCLPSAAAGADPLTFGDFTLVPEVGFKMTHSRNGNTENAASGYVGLTLTWQRQIGGLTFGTELYSEFGYGSAEDPGFFLVDDPVVDPGFWVVADRFGYLAFSHTSSAIGEHCIEAPTTGDNFAQGDYVTVGTCPAFDTRAVLYYRTPDLGGGVKLAFSYMPETRVESVEAGEVGESSSVAAILERELPSGATITASFGVERAFAVEGGGPRPMAWQTGLNWAQDGWTLGGAAALTDNGDGTCDRGFGIGVSRAATDRLTLSLGANRSESRAGGARLDETSVALIGMYTIVPDRLLIDGGIWRIWSDDGGLREERTVLGIGLSLTF